MNYFLTGGTGFIGGFLVPKLLARGGTVYLLTRSGSMDKVKQLRKTLGVDENSIVAIKGDLTKKNLGVSKKDLTTLKGSVDHVFHLAAVYDMMADAASQEAANVDGTRNAVKFAEAVEAGCFNHVSSIAVAGLYRGIFREDMFKEAEKLDNPYMMT